MEPPVPPAPTSVPPVVPVMPTTPSAAPPKPVAPVMTMTPKKSPWGMLIMVLVALLIIGAGVFIALKLVGGVNLGSLGKPKETKLTWWGLWEPNNVVTSVITEYEAAHPGIKIDYVFQSQHEYRERLQNALSQNTGPDIFRIHNTWVPMFKADLAPIPADVYSAAAFESAFYPVAKSDLRVGNSYVAVPLMYDGLALYTNDDLFAAAGKTVPTSWEELRNTAIDLSVCDSVDGKCGAGDKILVSGAALGTTDNVDHWQDVLLTLMLQNNVNLNAPTGRPAEEALQYYTIFNRSDHIWDSTLPNSTTAFASGKVAMYFGPSWRAHDILATNPTLKFSVHQLPQLPFDPARNEKPVTWASYWAEGVNKKSVNSKAAWDFVQFLSQPQTLQKLYQQAVSSGRAFGEIYPRQDMADLLKSAPYVSAYIADAPAAKSWYLASSTNDGPTGMNSLLSKYFEDAVNSVNQGQSATSAVSTLSSGVNQVLSRYGLVAATTVAP